MLQEFPGAHSRFTALASTMPEKAMTSSPEQHSMSRALGNGPRKTLVFHRCTLLLFAQMSDPDQDQTIYKVVLNHEEQYSIWPADRECPLGWREAGKSGTKDVCLAYINEVWTDMRPLSLRKQMEAARSGDA